MNQNNFVLPSLFIALSIIIFGVFIYMSADSFSNKGNSITVNGTSERIVESDLAKWNILLTKKTNGTDSAEVDQTNKSLIKSRDQIFDYIKKSKVENANVSFSPISTSDICELGSNGYSNCDIGVRAYNQSMSITVESDNVAKISELSRNINSEFPELTLSNNSVEYYYNKLKDIRVEMLSEATVNAKERAESVAKAGSARVGAITSLSSGVFQVTQKNSTDISDYGSYDTSTIEKKITATVKVDFSIK